MFQRINQRLRHLIIREVIEFFVFEGDKLLNSPTSGSGRFILSTHRTNEPHASASDLKGQGLCPDARIKVPSWQNHSTRSVTKKVRVDCEVRIELLQRSHVMGLNKGMRLWRHTPLRIDVLFDVLHSLQRESLRIFFKKIV